MTIKYALIVALVLAALACGQTPVASPTQDVRTPTPAPLPTSHPVAHSPTPIALTDLKAVELGSDYWPTDLSGERSVGIGRDGEIYLANVRTGETRQLTNDGYRKRRPVISGDTVAWTDQSRGVETHDSNSRTARGLADDIFVLDLNTGDRRRITEVPAKRSGLKISGKRLVWLDNRNEFGEHYTHRDIYAYDLEADEEIAVAVAAGAQHWVAIEGDRVVWVDNRNSPILGTDRSGCFQCPDNRFDIYLYDFTTGEELVLDDSGANNTMPDIHGDRVVWRDFDDEGRTAIRLYDIDTGEKRTLASPSLSGVDRPLVSGDYVVWTVGWPCDVFDTQSIDGSTGAFAHDLRTGEVKQLSNYVEPSITLDGTVVVIHEACQVGGRVYAVFLGTDADTGESAGSEARDSGDSEGAQQSNAGGVNSSSTQPPIEAVSSIVQSAVGGFPLRPLFEHLPDDRVMIVRLARALDAAIPILPDELLWANDRGRYLDVRYRDGMKIAIRQVARCEPWIDADAKESVGGRCKGKWVRQTDTWWVEGTGMVKSADLAQWWEDMTEFMVPIGSVGIPKTIRAGEPFTITLFSWDDVIDGDSLNLSLVSLAGAEIQLGAYPVSGTFQGQLSVPDQTPDGRYWLRVSGGSFSELVTIVHLE